MKFSPRSMTDVLHEIVLRRAPRITDDGLRQLVLDQEHDRFDPFEDQPTIQPRPVVDPRGPKLHATDAYAHLAAAVQRAVGTITAGHLDHAQKDLTEAAHRAAIILIAARDRNQP